MTPTTMTKALRRKATGAPGVLPAARVEPRSAGLALRLRDGRSVSIRAIRPTDAEPLREFDGGLSEGSRRFRYLGWTAPMSPERALALATVDFHARFALVATLPTVRGERIVADCRLVASAEPAGGPEIAIAVAEDHQDAGLGRALIRLMLAIAADHGIEAVVAQVRYDNDRMMHLLRELGFLRTRWELGVVTFTARPNGDPVAAGEPGISG